jgi:hypothetical protein
MTVSWWTHWRGSASGLVFFVRGEAFADRSGGICETAVLHARFEEAHVCFLWDLGSGYRVVGVFVSRLCRDCVGVDVKSSVVV